MDNPRARLPIALYAALAAMPSLAPLAPRVLADGLPTKRPPTRKAARIAERHAKRRAKQKAQRQARKITRGKT